MARLGSESDGERAWPKKRKRKEKKRQWVWTIEMNEDEENEKQRFVSTPIAAPGSPQTPIAENEEAQEAEEVEMTDQMQPLVIEAEAPEIALTEAPPGRSEDSEMMDRPDTSQSD
jgi:hypothetical protein